MVQPDGRGAAGNRAGARHGAIPRQPGARPGLRRVPGLWNYSREVAIDAPARCRQRGRPPLRLAVQVYPYAGNRRMLLTRDITALEQAEAMRRDFVANVSHEIRTPLTVLAGFVETLQTLPLEADERAHYLGLMAQQAQRMETLVERPADPVAAGRQRRAASQLWSPCGPCWRTARTRRAACPAGWRRTVIELSFDASRTTADVAGAPAELQSAMSNLVSNAVRYTPGGGEVAVGWRRAAGRPGEFCGAGQRPRHRARAHSAPDRALLPGRSQPLARDRRHRPGSGDRQARCAAPRRALRIESRPGQGSRFALVFPASRLRLRQPVARARCAAGGQALRPRRAARSGGDLLRRAAAADPACAPAHREERRGDAQRGRAHEPEGERRLHGRPRPQAAVGQQIAAAQATPHSSAP